MRTVDIHGVHVRVEIESPILAAGVEDLLRRFPEAGPADEKGLQVIYRNGTRGSDRRFGELPASGEELRFSSQWDTAIDLAGSFGISLDVYRRDRCLLFDFHRHGWITIYEEHETLSGHVIEPTDVHPAPLASFFFLLPLAELLATRGLRMIHAAALERNTRGILIPANSGSGKTTCCVSLMRAGYRCLSDDKPFLRDDERGITLLAFPEKIDVTEQTISFFPELRDAPPGVLKPGSRKKQFVPEALYPGATGNSTRPTVILFPQITGESRSRVEKLSKPRALEALLPHGLFVLDRDRAARHFDLLARLVEETDCYRLYFGQDVQDLPRLVDSLLG